jgi:signal transduction histidine kinase
MRQPIHALSMLNECLSDNLIGLTRKCAAASKELQSATTDAVQMRDVLAHLLSLADDFLIYSSITAKSEFSLKLEWVVLSDVCKRVKMVCGTLATERSSTFIVSLSDALSAMPVGLARTLDSSAFSFALSIPLGLPLNLALAPVSSSCSVSLTPLIFSFRYRHHRLSSMS